MGKSLARVVLLVAVLLVALSLTGCAVDSGIAVGTGSLRLEYVVIDGMPCLFGGHYKMGAVSCDWDQWHGKVVDGVVTGVDVR